MWQRFTEPARQVVYYAQEEARRRGVRDVETRHLLLGLLLEPPAPEGVWPPPPSQPDAPRNQATAILQALGVNRQAVCALLEKEESDAETTIEVEKIRLSASVKRVIDLAYREARQLAHTYIGTEHLLLGLIVEEKGIAAQTLFQCGVTLDNARQKVRLLTNGKDAPADRTPRWWHTLFGRK